MSGNGNGNDTSSLRTKETGAWQGTCANTAVHYIRWVPVMQWRRINLNIYCGRLHMISHLSDGSACESLLVAWPVATLFCPVGVHSSTICHCCLTAGHCFSLQSIAHSGCRATEAVLLGRLVVCVIQVTWATVDVKGLA